jgi:MOSC domain-containing protein YiiM
VQTVAERLDLLPQIGRVEWIGCSPAPRGEIVAVDSVMLLAGHGLEGDHHAKRRSGGERQVTLIQHEHFAAMAGVLHRDTVRPEQLRRNLVISGINLLALKGKRFRIGDCVLEYTGPCDPCSRMEETFGAGGLNAVRGHGGITARVHFGGTIRIGASVSAISPEAQG